jgi:hypothetical protein
MEGVAAQNPLNCHKTAPANPVHLYRLVRIGRTGRGITATGGEIGRNGVLIKPDQQQHCFPYENHDSTSVQEQAGPGTKYGKLIHTGPKPFGCGTPQAFRRRRGRINQQDQIKTRGQTGPQQTVRLPPQPFSPVSCRGITEFSCQGKTYPVIGKTAFHHKQLGARTTVGSSQLKNFPYPFVLF